MTPFDRAVTLIKGFEGFVGHVYDDGFGNQTVGYGETRPDLIKKYRKGITESEAADLLAERVRDFWDEVGRLCTRAPTDNQRVAYTSLAYNIGLGGFAESTTLARHNAGDTAGAAEAILWWNKVDGQVVEGLTRRRQIEHDLYLAGEKPRAAPLTAGAALATVQLVCLNSALPLDVAGGSPDDGASVIQWPGHGRPNQEWSLVPIPDGNPDEVAIVAAHSGKVMDVAEYSTEAGARVQQWDYHGGPNQRWRVLSTGNVLRLQSVHSGLFLDVRGNSIDAGMDLIQWEGNDGLNQMFMRVRLERTSALNPVTGPQPAPAPEAPPVVDPTFDAGDALRRMGGFPAGDEEDVYGFQAGFSFWDLAIDGDAGPETEKAIRYALDNGGRCGRYFTFAEFGCRHCGRCRISRFHVRQLDQYREHVGPVPIISGTRCDEHNAAVGGATNSQHRPYPNNRGVSTATDIPGAMTVSELADLGLFSGLGYVPSEGDVVVHADSRADGPNNTTSASRGAPTTWTY